MDQTERSRAPDGSARTPYVLSEKVRPPAPSGLVRERLERPLTGQDAPGLAFVFAPAGAGKTTLLARLAHLSPTPHAWFRLTASDSDEQQLAAGLARAVRGLVRPDVGVPRTLEDVLECLDRDGDRPGLLVLDDLHTVAGSGAETALERFLGLRPARLRVIVGSRRLPGWDLPQLLMSDSVVRVTADALRFRYWEVEELYAKVYREPLGPEAAATLTRRTGGWAAGLQLFHLATAGRGVTERRRAVAQLGGRSGLVRSYLVRNVLAELPQSRQDFMVVTSTLGVLTGQLCDELLDTSGSLQVLDELERAQMFTSSTDDGVTFRYHPVLEAHLHAALVERYGTSGAADLFRRSAGVLERSSFRRESLLAYARAEDWGAVARLLQEDGTELTVGGLAGGEQLLAAGRLAQDPWLTLALARLRSRQGDLRAAVDSYRAAEAMLEDRTFRTSCQGERAVAAAWLPEAGGRVSTSGPHWVDRLREALRRTRTDAPTPRPPGTGADSGVEGGQAVDHLANGVIALLDDDLEAARDALERAEGRDDASSTCRVAARLGLALLGLVDDGDPEPLSGLEQAVLEAEFIGHPFLARLSTAVMEAHLLPHSPAPARRSAHEQLLAGCRRHHDAWGEALAELSFGLGALHVAPHDAQRSLARAAELCAALDAGRLSAWAQAGQVLARSPVVAPTSFGAVLRQLAVQTRRGSRPTPVSRPASPASDDVRITCLGEFRCEVAGAPLQWGSTRPRARRLLRMLALAAPRPLHREQIIEVLWPDSELESGARQLHVAVSSLRRVLNGAGLTGTELISRRGDAYALVVPPGSLDVADFEAALREMDAARVVGDSSGWARAARSALGLYSGDLLPEDGPADWVVPHRDRLRRAAATAAAVVAADLRRHCDHEAAIAATHRWIELDPYADPAWELLSELHEDVGDRAAAARCRQDHGRLLADLGVL